MRVRAASPHPVPRNGQPQLRAQPKLREVQPANSCAEHKKNMKSYSYSIRMHSLAIAQLPSISDVCWPGPRRVTNPYKYQDGIWGVKMNDKQVLTAPWNQPKTTTTTITKQKHNT